MKPEEKTHLIDQITAAIAAHGIWKQRLRSAIASGTIDISVETIRVDNQCTFGKWLYSSSISPDFKQSDDYQTVLRLHAEFHKVAARVAELALAKKKQEAEALMQLNGDYARASSALTQAMIRWKNNIVA